MRADERKKSEGSALYPDFGEKELLNQEAILDMLPGAVLIYQFLPDRMELLFCSRGITSISGWKPTEFYEKLKQAPNGMIYPADYQRFQDAIAYAVRTRSRMDCIYRGFRRSGETCWLWMQGRMLADKDGYPVMQALLLDIERNANMYTGVLDEATAMISVIDCESYEVLYANRSAINATPDVEGEYIGSTCYRYIADLQAPCAHCLMSRAVPTDYDEREVQYGGRIYNQLFKIISWNGRQALLEYSEDITEQKQNLLYAEEQKNVLSRIVNYIPAGIMVFRFDRMGLSVAEANPAVCEMMNADRSKTCGVRDEAVLQLVHPDDISLCWNVITQLRSADSTVSYEYRSFNRKKHQYIWVSAHGRSVRQPDGSVLAYVSYVDITAEKKADSLQRKLTAAEQSAAAKAEFYSRMSHDMRTPMNGILGIASLAKQETDVSELRCDMEKIQQSGKYMLSLINDTLDLQRMENGHMKLEYRTVRGCDLLEDILSMVRPSMEEKALRLQVSYEPAYFEKFVRVDPVRIKQIAVNLLSNAIKFTKSGGTIALSVQPQRKENNRVQLLVHISDTGVGMSPEFLKQGAFLPFSQEVNEMTMSCSGSGLGLSIVKSLVERMGGTIDVESELGTGTTFRIVLEVELVPEAEVLETRSTRTKEQEKILDSLAGSRILLCEDHPLNAEIARRFLQKISCQVDWAKNGLEGVQKFQHAQAGWYDAILMDIRMPVMDGLSAANTIRSSACAGAKTIPIIAMSANAYAEDVQKSKAIGMNAHLAKPVDVQQLYKTLAECICKNAEK